MKLFNLAIEGITSFSVVPLRWSSYFGFISAFIALLYAINVIYGRIMYGNEVPGYSSLIVATLFIGGLILMSLGIIGEYIGKIYNETKKRPLYIIKDIYE